MVNQFLEMPKQEDNFPSLDEKLEQLYDEYCDEMGFTRDNEYIYRKKYDRYFRAELTDEKKKEIYRTDNKHFKRIHLDWEEI